MINRKGFSLIAILKKKELREFWQSEFEIKEKKVRSSKLYHRGRIWPLIGVKVHDSIKLEVVLLVINILLKVYKLYKV